MSLVAGGSALACACCLLFLPKKKDMAATSLQGGVAMAADA
jgi:hypothetical protein